MKNKAYICSGKTYEDNDGVSDNVFMLDTSKYPGAVIVRK